jgi:hypothetical protein
MTPHDEREDLTMINAPDDDLREDDADLGEEVPGEEPTPPAASGYKVPSFRAGDEPFTAQSVQIGQMWDERLWRGGVIR